MTSKRKTVKRRATPKGASRVATENRKLKTTLKRVTSILKKAITVKKRKATRKRSLL